MSYIRLFESFRNVSVEDILIEYIDDNHVKIFKNRFCEVCIFPQDSDMVEIVRERLSKFNINFKIIE